MTLKITLPILCLLILTGCNKLKEKENQFDFDKVEHYVTDNSNPIDLAIDKKGYHNLTNNEKRYLDILNKDAPDTITDTSSVVNLEKLNFKKEIIPAIKHKELKEIFNEEYCQTHIEYACVPTYRDIYVFRKNNQVTAIAKVCFDCEITSFTSKNNKWRCNLESEEYKLLKEINGSLHK